MSNTLTLFGAHWCPDCRNMKQFLGEIDVSYDWVDVEEDPDANTRIAELNNGKRVIPTLLLEDGRVLVNPSNADLATALGLREEPSRRFFDLIIVGTGPAGLTTAFYSAREGLSVLAIERSAIGGQTAITERLDNFPGFPDGIEGREFAGRLRAQAERFGVEILQAAEISDLVIDGNYRSVSTREGDSYCAKAIAIATGSTYRRMGIPGEDDLIGAGVHFCATCDGPFYRDREVAVVGGGNSAAEESLFLTRFASRVHLLVRGPAMKASPLLIDKVMEHTAITLYLDTPVVRLVGNGSLKEVVASKQPGGEEIVLPVNGLFVFIGLTPNTGWLPKEVKLDEYGFIVTSQTFETLVPGVFAAGDVRHGSTKQAASAAGEGAAVALMIREYLRTTGV